MQPNDVRTEEQSDGFSLGLEGDSDNEEQVLADQQRRESLAVEALQQRYAPGAQDDEGEEQVEQPGQAVAQPAAPPTAPPVEPPAPPAPKQYTPQYQQTRLTEEERTALKARLVSGLENWDAEQASDNIISAIEEVANRRVATMFDNYMAARVHTAKDQIEEMAQRTLFTAAQANPQILQNPAAIEAARYSAAIQYGMETGDIPGAIERVHAARRPAQSQQAPAPQAPAPRDRETGQFIPREMAVPSGGSGAPAGNPRVRRPQSNQSALKDALPFVPDNDLMAVFGRK